jgi:hypothetical protein
MHAKSQQAISVISIQNSGQTTDWFSELKVHKREKFFGSDFDFFTIL